MTGRSVLLAGPDQEENLSLRYLASSLCAAGHQVVIAPFNRAEDQASVVEAARGMDLVGLSLCFQVRAREFLELARALKTQAPHRPVVAGGHFASCAADELLSHHPEIDLVVIHEGERTLVEIADAGGEGEAGLAARLATIPGLVYREGDRIHRTEPRPVLEDLDALPRPVRIGPARLLAGVPTAYLLGSRGCLGRCAYCCITTLHRQATGKRFRQRDPERVAEEMAELYHQRGVRQFVFHDDNFLVSAASHNHRRLDALEAALERQGVRDFAFTIKCRPGDAEASIFRRLHRLGLIRVFLGVESASSEGLSCLGRDQSRTDAASTLALCREIGISAQYTMMIFHPASTLSTCATDLAFMKEHLDHPLNFCRTEIYAGTPLEQQMIAEGRARGSYLGRSYSFNDERVQWVCDVATQLFLGRCWSAGSLFERAIGLDHLAAVARRFYDDARIEELARRALAWRLSVNQDTVSLLEELFRLGSATSGREAALAWLRQEEQTTRARLSQQGLDLFEELNQLTLSLVGLERSPGRVVARPQPLGRRLARHAAAALLAVGVASFPACTETGVCEYAPPPVDAHHETKPKDAGVRIEIGVSEFAPPPVDGGVRIEIGVSEFAPPPVDGGVRIEIGVSEFAPPPVDARTEKE